MAEFQRRVDLFDQRNTKLIAASVDNLENARKTLTEYKLTFPLAYGLDAKDFSAKTGAFYNEEKGFLNGTNFIIRPDGRVGGAVYSTGPIGRYSAAEATGMIDYWIKAASRSHAK